MVACACSGSHEKKAQGAGGSGFGGQPAGSGGRAPVAGQGSGAESQGGASGRHGNTQAGEAGQATAGAAGTPNAGGASGASAGTGGAGAGNGGSGGVDCADSDRDGVCNATDRCPNLDDNVDIDSEKTPDCTQSLIKNSQFAFNVGDYDLEQNTFVEWSALDGQQSAHSGSIKVFNAFNFANSVRGVWQCAAAGPGDHALYAQVFIPKNQGPGNVRINASFRDSLDYATSNWLGAIESDAVSNIEQWTTLSKTFTAPAETKLICVGLRVAQGSPSSTSFAGQFDNILLN